MAREKRELLVGQDGLGSAVVGAFANKSTAHFDGILPRQASWNDHDRPGQALKAQQRRAAVLGIVNGAGNFF